jgi:threonine dehydrogenase-like Zn-dependent dehydrogenase
MRALAVFPSSRTIRLIDALRPRITQPRQALIRMRELGICGTDREIAHFQYGTPPPGSDHLIIGHESFGEVAEIGAGVKSLKVGDLVVLTVRRPCPHEDCPACRAGRSDFCATGDFSERGIHGLHGFAAGWVVEDEQYIVPVHPDLAEVAVLIEPLTIAAKAEMQLRSIQARLPWEATKMRVVVLGAGPVGLLGTLSLVLAGADVWVYSREPKDGSRARLVREMGADYLSSTEVPVDQLKKTLGDIDIIFEATGVSSFAFAAMKQLGPNGAFVLTGVPPLGEPKTADLDLLMRHLVLWNQLVVGTVNASRRAYLSAARQLNHYRALFPGVLRQLITRHSVDQALPLLEHPQGIKDVITLDGVHA